MDHSCHLGAVDRRTFLTLIGVGLLGTLGGCSVGGWGRRSSGVRMVPAATATTTSPPPRQALPAIPAPKPGRPVVVSSAPGPTSQVVLTVDDGYCGECVAGYVDFAVRTGTQLSFLPNGTFAKFWTPHLERLRPLVAAGQVQVANHTWSHKNITRLADASVRDEIQRNEQWIEDSFGITGRPYFRPPFGMHDKRTDNIAGSLGYTRILLWNGTLGDATVEKPEELLALADKWMRAGAIVLGHANHPAVLGVFGQLRQLIAGRHLEPVTLDAMLGTSRATG
jgi:hypothetical protein